MKKLIISLSLLLIASFLLVSCGETPVTDSSGTAATAETGNTAEESTEATTLSTTAAGDEKSEAEKLYEDIYAGTERYYVDIVYPYFSTVAEEETLPSYIEEFTMKIKTLFDNTGLYVNPDYKDESVSVRYYYSKGIAYAEYTYYYEEFEYNNFSPCFYNWSDRSDDYLRAHTVVIDDMGFDEVNIYRAMVHKDDAEIEISDRITGYTVNTLYFVKVY